MLPGHPMKPLSIALLAGALGAGVGVLSAALLLRARPAPAAPRAELSVATIPAGYRDWQLVSVAREEGMNDDIRAILGNDLAIATYREGRTSFPDGAVLTRIAWSFDPSEENNRAFGQRQSFVAGHPKNGVQFMIRDAKRYAATGGWGYAQFNDGQPVGEAALKPCAPCHEAARDRGFVFTRYSP